MSTNIDQTQDVLPQLQPAKGIQILEASRCMFLASLHAHHAERKKLYKPWLLNKAQGRKASRTLFILPKQ